MSPRFTDAHYEFLHLFGTHDEANRLVRKLCVRACRACNAAHGLNPDAGQCHVHTDPYESQCAAFVAELDAVMASPELLAEVVANA